VYLIPLEYAILPYNISLLDVIVPSLVNVPATPPTVVPSLIFSADKLETALITILLAIYFPDVFNVCLAFEGVTVVVDEYV
jgi:hypothetical protein